MSTCFIHILDNEDAVAIIVITIKSQRKLIIGLCYVSQKWIIRGLTSGGVK